MFLEQQISILELFLKDHVTLKTGVLMVKNQFNFFLNVLNKTIVVIFPDITN